MRRTRGKSNRPRETCVFSRTAAEAKDRRNAREGVPYRAVEIRKLFFGGSLGFIGHLHQVRWKAERERGCKINFT